VTQPFSEVKKYAENKIAQKELQIRGYWKLIVS
jgi:hypothetical protein